MTIYLAYLDLCLSIESYNLTFRLSPLNSSHAGNFLCFCCQLVIFSKLTFSKNSLKEHFQSVKRFRPKSGLIFVLSRYWSKLFAMVIRRQQMESYLRIFQDKPVYLALFKGNHTELYFRMNQSIYHYFNGILLENISGQTSLFDIISMES